MTNDRKTIDHKVKSIFMLTNLYLMDIKFKEFLKSTRILIDVLIHKHDNLNERHLIIQINISLSEVRLCINRAKH